MADYEPRYRHRASRAKHYAIVVKRDCGLGNRFVAINPSSDDLKLPFNDVGGLLFDLFFDQSFGSDYPI